MTVFTSPRHNHPTAPTLPPTPPTPPLPPPPPPPPPGPPSHRDSASSPSQDRIMIVRAVGQQYSTFTVACDNCSHNNIVSSSIVNTPPPQQQQHHLYAVPSEIMGGRASFSGSTNLHTPVTPSSYSVPANLTINQVTPPPTTVSSALGDNYRILVPTAPDSTARIPRMPPSYSSIFRAGCAVLISEQSGQSYIATKDDCLPAQL